MAKDVSIYREIPPRQHAFIAAKVYGVTTLRARDKNPIPSHVMILTCAAVQRLLTCLSPTANRACSENIYEPPASSNTPAALDKAGVETPSRRTYVQERARLRALSVESLVGTSVAVC